MYGVTVLPVDHVTRQRNKGVVRKNMPNSETQYLNYLRNYGQSIGTRIYLNIKTVKIGYRMQHNDVITNPAWRTATHEKIVMSTYTVAYNPISIKLCTPNHAV